MAVNWLQNRLIPKQRVAGSSPNFQISASEKHVICKIGSCEQPSNSRIREIGFERALMNVLKL